jgi:magnesium transporter
VQIDALEDLIYTLSRHEHRDLLKRMGVARRRLSHMRQRLWSKRDILVSLVSKDWETFLSGVQIPYLRDVYDHVVRMLQKLEIASELLSTLQSTYLSNVSIDTAEASNNVNAVMKTLSSVATIILPLTLVTGMFGMNVTVPCTEAPPQSHICAATVARSFAHNRLPPACVLCCVLCVQGKPTIRIRTFRICCPSSFCAF